MESVLLPKNFPVFSPLIVPCSEVAPEGGLLSVEGRAWPVLDGIAAQWAECYALDHPHLRQDPFRLRKEAQAYGIERAQETAGNWVLYPWLNLALRVLPETEFIRVRTSRNRLKISSEEAAQLHTKTIGIIGLSVGQSVALTLAMERTFGTLRISDHDTLDLSNLNRVRAGLQNLGLPKTAVAARLIAELDPYLKVELYPEGIDVKNVRKFVQGLDLLIEECDALDIKLLSRMEARENEIPVLMDTSDRGMLDVERFDLEPDRPLFHGLAGPHPESIGLTSMDPEHRLGLMMRIVDYPNLSPSLRLSYEKIGTELLTWPQLASDVQSGAGHTAAVARNILLGHPVPSGRYYIEMDPQRVLHHQIQAL